MARKISVRDALAKERRSMGRPIRMENWRYFEINGHEFFILFYSLFYKEIGREYRYAIFHDGQPRGGGIVG